MKTIARILSGLLILTLVLSFFVSSVRAEAPADPGYDLCKEIYGTAGYYPSFSSFEADIWASDYYYDKISDSYILPFRYTVENLESSKSFIAGQYVWEATNILNADCGAFTEGVRRYEEMIICLLGMDIVNFDTEYEKHYDSAKLEGATALVSEISDALGTASGLAEESLEAIFSDIDFSRLGDADYIDSLSDVAKGKVGALENTFDILKDAGKIAQAVDVLTEIASICTDISDVYDLYATIVSLSDLYGEYSEALSIMSAHADGAMAQALKNVSDYCAGFISADTFGNLYTDMMLNHDVNVSVLLAEELIAGFTGIYGAGIFAGVSIANFSIDALYNFSESNEIYYSMKALKEFDDSLSECLELYRGYTLDGNGDSYSDLFLSFVDLKTKVFSLGMEYTVNFIDSTQDQGLVNQLAIFLGRDKTMDEAVSNMNACLASMQDIVNTAYDNAYYYWPLYKEDYLSSIDYDKMALIEEVAVTPIPYIEVSEDDLETLEENCERYRNIRVYLEDSYYYDGVIHFGKDYVQGKSYTLDRDININGRITVESGTLDLNGHSITCREIIMEGGTIKVGTGSITTIEGITIGEKGETLTIEEDEDNPEYYKATSSGRILMSSDKGTLNVGGDFVLCSSKTSKFEAGTVNLSGDLLVYRSCLECSESSRFNFTGSKEQLISSESPIGQTRIFFNEVSFANENIVCDELFSGRLVSDAKIKFNKKLSHVPETFDTNGKKLTVNGDLSLDKGLFYIGSTVEITGNLTIGNEDSTADDYVGITMDSDSSELIIDGNFTVYTQGQCHIKAGIIDLKGNLDAYAPFYFYETGATDGNGHSIRWGSTNKVSFSGTGEQHITSHIPEGSGAVSFIEFNYLKSQNPSLYAHDMFAGALYDDSVINFPEDVIANEYFDINGHTLTIPGNINITAGIFKSRGTLNVGGNLSIGKEGEVGYDPVSGREYRLPTSTGSIKSDEYLNINIDGDFTICSNAQSQLTSGTIRLKGNLNQYGNFALSGSGYNYPSNIVFEHTGLYDKSIVIFCGDNEQTIYTEQLLYNDDGMREPGLYFGVVIFENTHIKANRFFGGKLGSDATISFTGDVIGCDKHDQNKFDLNGHTLTIHGNLNVSDGILSVNNGTLIVDGTLSFGKPGDFEDGYRLATSAGSLYLDDSGVLNVKGDFIYCSSGESDLWGKLNLAGDFVNCGNYYKNFYGYYDDIPDSNTRYAHHLDKNSLYSAVVTFNGTDRQTIVQDSYYRRYDTSGQPQYYPECVETPNTIFGEVHFENENVYSDKMFGLYMTEDLTLNLPENIVASPYIEFNEFTLTIPGNLNLTAGEFEIKNGTVNIMGNLSLGTEGTLEGNERTATSDAFLDIYGGNAILNVSGDFTICSSMRSYLEECRVNLKNDLNLFGTSNIDNGDYAVDSPLWLLSGAEIHLTGGDYQKVYFERANNEIEVIKDYPVYTSVLSDTLNYKLFDREDGTKSLSIWISTGARGTISPKSDLVLVPWEEDIDNISEIQFSDPDGGTIKITGDNVFNDYPALKEIYIDTPVNICDYAFAGNTALETILFESKADIKGTNAFQNVTADVYYYRTDGWTDDEIKDYGGTLTWINCDALVTLNGNGGWFNGEESIEVYASLLDYFEWQDVFPVPSRPFYECAGYTFEDGTDFDIFDSRFMDGVTLYARWEPATVPESFWVYGIHDADYTGKAITFNNLEVYYQDNLLTAGSDYTVKYKDNVNVGTATVTITGKGVYSGSFTDSFKIRPLDISEGTLKKDTILTKYNKKVQKLTNTITYTLGGKNVTLSSKKDYDTVFAGTDKNAPDYSSDAFKAPGTYYVTLNGKGNYTGSLTYSVNITECTLASSFKVSMKDAPYNNGEPAYPASLTVKSGNKALTGIMASDLYEAQALAAITENPCYDYVWYASDNIEVGKATLTIVGVEASGFSGTITKTYSVKGTSIAKAKVTGLKSSYPWNAEGVKPMDTGVTVTLNKTVLTGCDKETYETLDNTGKRSLAYIYEYVNNDVIGKAKINITGVNGYTGKLSKTFTVTGSKITASMIKGFVASYEYTGNEITQEALEVGTLVEGSDYTVTYKNNVNAGTATVTVAGINAYNGSVKKTFKITRASLNTQGIECTLPSEAVYVKGGVKPEPAIRDSIRNRDLVAGKDFTLKYKNNTAVNDGSNLKKLPTVTITGNGNYSGTLTQNFTIVPGDLKNVTYSVVNVKYQKKPGICKPSITLKDTNGKKLAAGTDYNKSVIYTYAADCTVLVKNTEEERKSGDPVGKTDIIPVGTEMKATFTGIKNYKGSLTVPFKYVTADLSTATVTLKGSQVFSHEAIPLTPEDLTVKVSKKEIPVDNYTIIAVDTTIKKGYVTVTIEGVGEYGGTKTVSLKLKALSMNTP